MLLWWKLSQIATVIKKWILYCKIQQPSLSKGHASPTPSSSHAFFIMKKMSVSFYVCYVYRVSSWGGKLIYLALWACSSRDVESEQLWTTWNSPNTLPSTARIMGHGNMGIPMWTLPQGSSDLSVAQGNSLTSPSGVVCSSKCCGKELIISFCFRN